MHVTATVTLGLIYCSARPLVSLRQYREIRLFVPVSTNVS